MADALRSRANHEFASIICFQSPRYKVMPKRAKPFSQPKVVAPTALLERHMQTAFGQMVLLLTFDDGLSAGVWTNVAKKCS